MKLTGDGMNEARGQGDLLRTAAFLLALAVALVSAMAFSARADAARAHVFWTTKSGNIGRSNLNGGGVQRRFIKNAAVNPSAIAVANRHIYWVDTNRNVIGRSRLDGTGVNRNFLSFPGNSVFQPRDVAVGGGYLYWTDTSGFIGRAKLNGSKPRQKFIQVDGGYSPGHLAVNSHNIFWTAIGFMEPNKIGRANLKGRAINHDFITSPTSPWSLTVARGFIYWTTPRNAIVWSKLNGKGVRPRFQTRSEKGQPGTIAAGSGSLYWTSVAHTSGEGLAGWIGHVASGHRNARWFSTGADGNVPTDVAVG